MEYISELKSGALAADFERAQLGANTVVVSDFDSKVRDAQALTCTYVAAAPRGARPIAAVHAHLMARILVAHHTHCHFAHTLTVTAHTLHSITLQSAPSISLACTSHPKELLGGRVRQGGLGNARKPRVLPPRLPPPPPVARSLPLEARADPGDRMREQVRVRCCIVCCVLCVVCHVVCMCASTVWYMLHVLTRLLRVSHCHGAWYMG